MDKKSRQVENNLRGLFCHKGFVETEVNKFEDYNLYMDHKNFLETDRLVSFMDAQGRLMVLKPDITLSIVKNIEQSALGFTQKLYYVDEVIRFSKENSSYNAIRQIGVEVIGRLDNISKLEIISLAQLALGEISNDYILDISHMDFVRGFLKGIGLSLVHQEKALEALHTKSGHNLKALLTKLDLPQETIEQGATLLEINSNISEGLKQAENLVINEEMQQAYNQLCVLEKELSDAGISQKVNLDFSVVSDLDYYNGFSFLGYVNGVPKAVLSGGEYSNLLTKMENENEGMGFALSLNEIDQYFPKEKKVDFDVMIVYSADANYSQLLKVAEEFQQQGRVVRLEPESCIESQESLNIGQIYKYENNSLVEVESYD